MNRRVELDRLQAAFEATAATSACRLMTLLGPAGIGKTRIAEELVRGLGGRARVLTGRCLPYGDGITFWPLIEVLRALGPDGLETALAEAADREAVTERLRAVIGGDTAAVDELFWAARRLVESLAIERPLVLMLEDLDRAEPTLLDLVDYLHSRVEAPVLLLCLARADLLERRPGWPGARERTEIVVLEPLSEHDAASLLTGLGADLDRPARERVLRSAEGNPLYVEQLAALAETGELVVPPTIQALLSERLDRLEAGERSILERASIVGQEFSRRAVTDLCPPELRADVGRHLLSLVRKELVRPHASASSTEDGFRFRHALIRDVAYEAMPKEARALFHEWFADWLERNAGERLTEIEEIVGYHLEQAVRLRGELGPGDDRTQRLARRATARLGTAGKRALAREDIPAAVSLLERATSLEGGSVPELCFSLSQALWSSGEVDRAAALLREVIEAASATGDENLEVHARLEEAARLGNDDESLEIVKRFAEAAAAASERTGDELGIARALRRIAWVHRLRCENREGERVAERALEHARRAGDTRELARIADGLCTALIDGPAPVNEAIVHCDALLRELRSSPLAEANVRLALGALKAMAGEFLEARDLYRASKATYEELGLRFALAGATQIGGDIELLAGDPEGAERELREGYEILADVAASAQAAMLSRALELSGRTAEAEELLRVAALSQAPTLTVTEVTTLSVGARLEGRKGRHAEAVALGREAVAVAARTDALNVHGGALVDLAHVLALSGEDAAAQRALDEAAGLFGRKGNTAAANSAASALGRRHGAAYRAPV